MKGETHFPELSLTIKLASVSFMSFYLPFFFCAIRFIFIQKLKGMFWRKKTNLARLFFLGTRERSEAFLTFSGVLSPLKLERLSVWHDKTFELKKKISHKRADTDRREGINPHKIICTLCVFAAIVSCWGKSTKKPKCSCNFPFYQRKCMMPILGIVSTEWNNRGCEVGN